MRKYFGWIIMSLMAAFLLVGCKKEEMPEPGEPFVYYLNREGTGIEKRPFDWRAETGQEEMENILEALTHEDKNGKYRAVIPEDVKLQKSILESRKVDLYFSKEYEEMDKSAEVLCRAAVVQSLFQIAEVELVKFYVENEPLKDENGKEVGYMNAYEFVQNTGESLSSFRKAELLLYLPNTEGTALKKENREIHYSSNTIIEKVVIEQLMQEPNIPNQLVIIPPETILLSVTVRDGICYVNFDSGFLTSGYLINPELSIYSIVNSVVGSGTASQVQFSVNGKTDILYQNSVDLSKPISMNRALVEEVQ